MEARYERRANRAAFERATFMTMVTSGRAGAFIAAMKNFGPIQTLQVTIEPELLKPWEWFKKPLKAPNKEHLWLWARGAFERCSFDSCGHYKNAPTVITYRIDLRTANLREADLREVKLSKADLRGANLILADLILADLRGAYLSAANLRGANLIFADLREANLRGANLSGADLREAKLDPDILCGARTLVKVILDPEIEAAVKQKCPKKLEK